MFARAGLNLRGIRLVCRAKVSLRRGGRGAVWGYVLHFPCGDYQVASSTQIHWPHLVTFHNLINPRGVYGHPRLPLEYPTFSKERQAHFDRWGW